MKLRNIVGAVCLALGTLTTANAAVIYPDGSWTNENNQPAVGNYILNVTDLGSTFRWQVTVNPWNAEALGLFMDLGNVEIPNSFTTAGKETMRL